MTAGKKSVAGDGSGKTNKADQSEKKVWEKEKKRKVQGLKETDGRDKLNVTRAVKTGKNVWRK